MDITTSLTGILPFIIISAAMLTVMAAAGLLWMYRRATLRAMSTTSTGVTSENHVNASGAEAIPGSVVHGKELAFVQLEELPGEHDPDRSMVLRRIKMVQRRAMLVYLAGALAYALVMTLTWSLVAGGGLAPGRILVFMSMFLWPGVVTLYMAFSIDRGDTIRLFGAYAIVMSLAILVALVRNPGLPLLSPVGLWFMINLPASLLLVFFLHSRVRSVGPLVLVFMLCGVAGAVFLLELLSGHDVALRAVSNLGYSLGLGAVSVFILLQLAGFILFAIFGRSLLRMIGKAYRHKHCSDRSITLDAMWLMFAVTQSIGFAFENLWYVMAAPLAFLAWRGVVTLGLRRLQLRTKIDEKPLELLLLRVFSLGRRSDRFFDRFSRVWRTVGIVNMIAGPDLVTSALEPHEFLEFVGGSLSRRFVVSKADLEHRLAALDRLPDPDGRYRVHEFFCHEDTWRMTMQRLAVQSDAVLMDLRSFSQSNRGCLFELKVLLDMVPLQRTVFIIDDTTDRSFLEHSLHTLWEHLDQDSPNLTIEDPTVILFAADVDHRRSLSMLTARLSTRLQPSSPRVYEPAVSTGGL